MARKNLLASVAGPDIPVFDRPANPDREAGRLGVPCSELSRHLVSKSGAFGSIGRSLDNIAHQAEEAEKVSALLAAGSAVVELDPALIDDSFITDRMPTSAGAVDHELRDSIEQNGQQVPILVRPHPSLPGRYQVAYGHRRLRAIASLGKMVRAVVRALDDEQLVVAQGQENNARTNLSFIERATFAAKLEERRFSRDVISAAVSADKPAISRLISLAQRIPRSLIESIGPAPAIGRVRWSEVADMLAHEDARQRAYQLVEDPRFLSAQSDQRFEKLYSAVKPRRAKAVSPTIWTTPEGKRVARITQHQTKVTLVLDEAVEPEFGQFIIGQLEGLYATFKTRKRV
jgi:ParB family chromosome partitioning protein